MNLQNRKVKLAEIDVLGVYRCGSVERFRDSQLGSNSPSGNGGRVFKSTSHPVLHRTGAKLRASFLKTSKPFGALT